MLFAAIALLPSALWYGHAYQIAMNFYPHHFFVAGGVRIMSIPRLRDAARPFHWWLAAMILFMVIVGYGNRHPWYQLPLIPIAAAFGGAACAFLGSKMSSRLLAMTLSILLASSF